MHLGINSIKIGRGTEIHGGRKMNNSRFFYLEVSRNSRSKTKHDFFLINLPTTKL